MMYEETVLAKPTGYETVKVVSWGVNGCAVLAAAPIALRYCVLRRGKVSGRGTVIRTENAPRTESCAEYMQNATGVVTARKPLQ